MDDVQCIAHCPPMCRFGSYDGRIIVWSLDTARPKFHLDASQYEEAINPTNASVNDASAGCAASLAEVRTSSVESFNA